jgi:predicted RNase H-like nuclease
MGYLGNHLATVVVSIFASILTWLYFVMPDALHQLLLVSSIVTWFLVGICWAAQKSADYAHKHSHAEKKSSTNIDHKPQTAQVKTATSDELSTAKAAFTVQLNELHDTVKLKDGEIDRLKQQIASLETLVQIEALKAELANLKVLASKEKTAKKK